MSFENPLNKIKKMNADNRAQKAQEEALEKEQEIQNQENIDEQYELLDSQKQAYSNQVEDFKQRIAEISGTQEEMIGQYREAISEAKKDAETLKYVKENFDEIFGEAKLQWKEAGTEKISNIGQRIEFENSINDLDNQMQGLYPETSEGQQELKNSFKEYFKNDLQSILFYGARELQNEDSINKFIEENNISREIFDEIRKNTIESSIDSYLEKKYNSIELNENMELLETSHQPSEIIYVDRLKSKLEYEMNLSKKQKEAQERFLDFKQEYINFENKYNEIRGSNEELDSLLSTYGFRRLKDFTYYLNPDSIETMLDYRDPQELIDSMNKLKDLEGILDSLSKDYNTLKKENGLLSATKLGDYLKGKNLLEISTSPNKTEYISEKITNLSERLRKKYSNEELLELIEKQELKKENEKEAFLEKFSQVL